MNTPFDFSDEDARVVYVKPVQVTDLPRDVQEQLDGVEQLYAVHSEDGEQLALVSDRDAAFVLARQHDYAPVTVH